MKMATLDSPAFRLCGIRDFLPLPSDRFGFRKQNLEGTYHIINAISTEYLSRLLVILESSG
jgi:hypothetical protein